jgi:hypothetical protein
MNLVFDSNCRGEGVERIMEAIKLYRGIEPWNTLNRNYTLFSRRSSGSE